MNNMSISLCMIVKDEESVLTRCLESVKGVVDEIIIVDTGSTDNTKRIAQQYTNKIYDFKWVNDFSAARNESLKYATGNWILVLDADEYFDEKDAQTLRSTLQKSEPNENTVYSISVLSFLGKQRQSVTGEAVVPRIFPNRMGIHYTRPIHEQLTSKKGTLIPSLLLPIKVYHSGYTEETVAAKDKHSRNLSIFEQVRKKTGFSAYDHLMLGNQYLMMGQNEKALYHLNKSIRDKNKLGNIYKNALFSIMQVYFNMGRIVDAWNFTEQHLGPYLSYPDILAWRGVLLLRLGFMDQAKTLFLKAVSTAEERANAGQEIYIVSPDTGLSLPLKQLAEIYEQEGNYNQAVFYLTKILMTNAKDYKALGRLILILSLQNEQSEVVISFFERLLETEDRSIVHSALLTIAIGLGLKELSRTLIDHKSAENSFHLWDHLRYALMINDLEYFRFHWARGNPSDKLDPRSLRQAVLSAIVWGKSEYLKDDIGTEHECYSYIQWANSICLQTNLNEDINKFPGYSLELLSDLYTIQQYDAFDSLIDRVESPEIINGLANFFYDRHQEQTAFQYYSHLINDDQLDVFSCTNLALYYSRNNSPNEAIMFLEKALQLKPNEKIIYTLLYNIASDPIKKKETLQKLFAVDSSYRHLNLLK
jgi:glycosyltransferase involved in cell wall biosynthesis